MSPTEYREAIAALSLTQGEAAAFLASVGGVRQDGRLASIQCRLWLPDYWR